MRFEVEPYDPCPCGSGKKFKFCCAGKSRKGKYTAGAIVEEMAGRIAPIRKRKMSGMISEMAADFLWKGDTIDEMQSRLIVACTAWNLACGTHEIRHQNLERYRKELAQFNPATPPVELANLIEDVESLIERKQEMFPYDLRQIVSANVVMDGKTCRIEVVSATGM